MASVKVELQKNLSPKILKEEDVNFISAKMLHDKLCEGATCNIAVTGYYGTGKSSVIKTAEDLSKDNQQKFLKISLATLQCKQGSDDEPDIDATETEKDDLQHIELSILQQILYQESQEKLPLSNVKRMTLQNKDSIQCLAIDCVIFILCFFVLFEPEWARVDTLYNFFDWGEINILFDAIAACFLIGYTGCALYKWIIPMIIRGRHNVKVGISGAEVELSDEKSSVFNRHIEEIFYFFRNTDYNVVAFEDLDRFETTELFLKLRELNLLLNANKNIGRHITFVYAVRDDIFDDSSRTKFFDYIVPVIPIINRDNGVQMLREFLHNMGEEKITDDDIENIGCFIKDIRLMQNICNEYQIYQANLSPNLEHKKLLAMIAYKNCYPRDFSFLTRSDERSKVYNCITHKQQFSKWAVDRYNSDGRKRVEENLAALERLRGLKQSDLMSSFLLQILKRMNQSYKFEGFEIGDKTYTVWNLSQDKEAFTQLIKLAPNIKYKYTHKNYGGYRTEQVSISVQSIEKEMGLERPILEILNLMDTEKIKELEASKRNFIKIAKDIPSCKLSTIIIQHRLNECEDFKALKLEPMQELFLCYGYIDENFCDYTSRFIKGSLTEEENRLLIEMKLHHITDFNSPIIHHEAFVKKLPSDVYRSPSILNISLVAFLAKGGFFYKAKFNMICDYVANHFSKAGEFILNFYKSPTLTDDVKHSFLSVLTNDYDIWDDIQTAMSINHEETYMDMWLSYCKKDIIGKAQRQWLSENYQFLARHWGSISMHRSDDNWLEGCKFKKLTDESSELLDIVLKYRLFIKDAENFCVMLKHLNFRQEFTKENLNLTRMLSVNNPVIRSFVNEDLEYLIINVFSKIAKDESPDSLKFIVNNIGDNVCDSVKEYLQQQENKIEYIEDVKNEQLVLETNILRPSWDNFIKIYNKTTDGLRDYQQKFFVDNAKGFIEQPYPQNAPYDFTFMILFGTWIPDSVAMRVSGQIEDFISGEGRLSSLSIQRIEKLLNDKHISYCDHYTKELAKIDEKVYRKYLLRNKEDVFTQIQTTPLTDSLVRYFLFEQKQISNDNRALLLRSPNAQTAILANSELAKDVAVYLTKKTDEAISPEFYQKLLNKITDEQTKSNLAKTLTEIFKAVPRWVAIFRRYIKY